jgi:hypothetical protein
MSWTNLEQQNVKDFLCAAVGGYCESLDVAGEAVIED